MLGCAGYLISVFGQLLLPHYSESAIASVASLPAALGEIGTGLWLLVLGTRRGTNATSSTTAKTRL
jgi:hypothetical protein